MSDCTLCGGSGRAQERGFTTPCSLCYLRLRSLEREHELLLRALATLSRYGARYSVCGPDGTHWRENRLDPADIVLLATRLEADAPDPQPLIVVGGGPVPKL